MARHPNTARNPKRAIRILNPAAGAGWTSVKRATRFVAQGRARYVSETCIEMIEGDYRHLAAGRIERPVSEGSAAIDVQYAYAGPANLRTFAHYPDALAFVY